MKTILVYAQQPSAGYIELYLSLMREGRRRGWGFAIVEPMAGPGEAKRMGEVFVTLHPSGFVGGYIDGDPIVPPAGMPSVWIDTSRPPPGGSVVRHDNASFGIAAADALATHDTGFAVFGLGHHHWSAARERAFAERLHERGRRCRIVRLHTREKFQYMALGEVRGALSRMKRPVSVFAVTDQLASVVLMAADALGWKCPRDIRLIGVDDNEIVCMNSPVTLTSVHPDWALGGRLVAEALEVQMRGGRAAPEYIYGAAGVTRRASTRIPYVRSKDERVERALAFIASEFSSPIDVGDVVEAMGYSRSHGELRFREETGKTILATLEEMRWQRLVVLLGRRDADLSSLPDLCGFRSASALRQFFRRRTGMSMTSWRNIQNRRNIFQTK